VPVTVLVNIPNREVWPVGFGVGVALVDILNVVKLVGQANRFAGHVNMIGRLSLVVALPHLEHSLAAMYKPVVNFVV